jgi:hypothetical protein
LSPVGSSPQDKQEHQAKDIVNQHKLGQLLSKYGLEASTSIRTKKNNQKSKIQTLAS